MWNKMQKLKTVKLNETEEKIIGMLKENTGIHFLDSGSAYGRHWEQNQKIDYSKTKSVQLEVWADQVMIQKSVFYFLVEHLEITKESKKYQKLFDLYEKGHYTQFLKRAGDKIEEYARAEGYITKHDKSWLQIMREFGNMMGEESWTENTYNFETILSQDIQYTIFTTDEGDFILLQVHNGTDIRGGYTVPHIFEIYDYHDFIRDMSDINAQCKCSSWYSDDAGYHWYFEGQRYNPDYKQLDLFGNEAKILDKKFNDVQEIDVEKVEVKCKLCNSKFEFW